MPKLSCWPGCRLISNPCITGTAAPGSSISAVSKRSLSLPYICQAECFLALPLLNLCWSKYMVEIVIFGILAPKKARDLILLGLSSEEKKQDYSKLRGGGGEKKATQKVGSYPVANSSNLYDSIICLYFHCLNCLVQIVSVEEVNMKQKAGFQTVCYSGSRGVGDMSMLFLEQRCFPLFFLLNFFPPIPFIIYSLCFTSLTIPQTYQRSSL